MRCKFQGELLVQQVEVRSRFFFCIWSIWQGLVGKGTKYGTGV